MIAIASLFLQILQPLTIDRWVSTGSDAEGTTAIDPQSIRRAGNIVQVIVRTRINRSSTGRPIIGVMRFAYNCRTGTARLQVADIYREDGSFIGRNQNPPPEEPVPAGSTP